MASLTLNKLLNLFFFLFIGSLALGQLSRIPVPNFSGAVFLNDIFLTVLIGLWIIKTGLNRFLFLPIASQPMIIFILISFVSLINSLSMFSVAQIAPGVLLFLRFVSYFMLYLIVANYFSKQNRNFLLNFLVLIPVFVAVCGFIQLVILPDLTFLTAYGWDPHQSRLASTFIDPNFTGAFLILGLILGLSLYLQNKKTWLLISVIILFVAVVLTFSRSSYLMLFSALLVFAILKSKKIGLISFSLFLLAIFTLPRVQDRLMGAFTIDETARARIISWQNAQSIIVQNPLLGVGFNNYRQAQVKYGFFEVATPSGGHSGAGSDSTVLTIAATSGIIGALFYLIAYFRLIVVSFLKRTKNQLALINFISLIALFIHSQFVNSLLYPAIMAWVWILNGMLFGDDE